MSTVTEPIVLDKTFAAKIDALNHLISHQNAAIDLLASDKRSALAHDVATVANMCAKGEILEVMDYGDYIDPAWSEGENNYNPAMNLCHEADAELEDGETIHGAFFEWDKTTPTGVPFDEPEAIAYFDGTEGAGDAYIEISVAYGDGWKAGDGIQITLTEAPAEGDQLVISLGTDSKNDPTNGRTWNVYAKGSTTSKQTGTTSKGKNGTEIGATSTLQRQQVHGGPRRTSGIVRPHRRQH